MGYLDTAFFTSQDAGNTAFGNHDNGIFEFLATLGMLGTLFYASGVAIILVKGIAGRLSHDVQIVAYTAVTINFLVQLPTGNSLFGVDGFIFWLTAALLLRQTSDKGETLKLKTPMPTFPIESYESR